MKIMIEVSGGCITNIVATQECSVYIVDHDNLRECGAPVEDYREAMQPYRTTYEEGLEETPVFDECLQETLAEYEDRPCLNDSDMPVIAKRLEYLREQIKQENISYGEIVELQSLVEYIPKNDVELLQWADTIEA